MRLLSRVSSVIAATALAGTSLVLAVPAFADEVEDVAPDGGVVAVNDEELEQEETVLDDENPEGVLEDEGDGSGGEAGAVATMALADANIADLTLLNINDFHGRIVGTLNSDHTQLVDSAKPTDFTTVKFGYTVESLRQDAGADNTLFLSAGDNVGATLFASAVQKDVPTIDLLNTLGLDATAVGNHEFDAGWNDLDQRLQKLFNGPLIAANVLDATSGKPVLPTYAILDAADLKVAVTGAVTQQTPSLVSPDNVSTLKFTDPVDAVNGVVAELVALDPADRPDIIVAEYHEGAATGTPGSTLAQQVADVATFAKIVNGTSAEVNAIFNGHTHQTYAWDGPVPGDVGSTRPIVSTGNYGENVGKVVLSVDKTTKDVTNYTAENVNTVDYTTGKTNADMVKGEVMSRVYDITLDALQTAEKEGSKPTGRMSATISRAYTGGEYVDGLWQKTEASKEDRGNESPIAKLVGNMLLEGQMSTLPEAPDFGVTNPGGLRTDLEYGDDGIITVAMARSVLPFTNELSVVTLTGKQVITMLEQQWQRKTDGTIPDRAFLQLGLSDNVSYTFHEIDDPKIAGAKRGVIDSVTINGEPIDPDATYRAGTFTFLAAGGDNFRVFNDAVANVNTGLVDWESWLAYLSDASGYDAGTGKYLSPIEPQFTRQGLNIEGIPAGGLEAGSEAALTIKNTNLRAVGAPENDRLTLFLGGDFVGAFTVVSTQSETGNWSDSTKAVFRVPSTFDGSATFGVVASVADPQVRRLGGASRYATNLAVNAAADAEKGAPVFVATSMDFADALSIAPAVALTGGSLYLTNVNGLSKEALTAMKAQAPREIFIVGGKGAVSTKVFDQLRTVNGLFPERVSGSDRYATNAQVLSRFFGQYSFDSAFVATGRDYPDALSASAAGGALGAPVVLVNGTKGTNLSSEALTLLKRQGVTNILVTGGDGVVNKKIETNLKKSFASVERLSGVDRYKTNMAVNDYLNGLSGFGPIEGMWVATGANFPDALSAAAPAGQYNQRLVLSNGKCIAKDAVEWVNGPASTVSMTTLVGGTGVLPVALEKLPACK